MNAAISNTAKRMKGHFYNLLVFVAKAKQQTLLFDKDTRPRANLAKNAQKYLYIRRKTFALLFLVVVLFAGEDGAQF